MNVAPGGLVYYETFTDRLDALRRERNLKRGKTNKELRDFLRKEKIDKVTGPLSPT